MNLTMMDRVGDRKENMEGSCSTGQSPQRDEVPVEEEEEEEEEEEDDDDDDDLLPPQKFVQRSESCCLFVNS
jgi:hypothetical protein